MQKRIERLREKMKERNIDALYVIQPENRRYVTGFTGTEGYAVVTLSDAFFLTDFRYMDQAKKQCQGFTVIEHKKASLYETLHHELNQRGVRQLAFEKNAVTYGTYETLREKLSGIELQPVSGLIEGIRQIKDEEEIGLIREAARIADAAFSHILTVIRPGIKETDIALELEIFMRKMGATSSSFDTIVASGHRSSLPHGVASDKVLEAGDFVKLDFGAYYEGYCSDITRTVVLGPGPSDRQREIYEIVLHAQLQALENLRAGLTGRAADALARDYIASKGYGDQFGHSLGHGVGLAIHEGPALSAVSEDVLVPGMVVTVEPGIYLSGFGGVRIEDDVWITESGIEILTHSPKDLIVL